MEKSTLAGFDVETWTVAKLKGAGSNRRYFRVSHPERGSMIWVKNENRAENTAFITLAHQMKNAGLSVPEIIEVSADQTEYLQQDLGETSLYDVIEMAKKAGRPWSDDVFQLMKKVMRDLPRIQFLTAKGLDANIFLREKEFSEQTILWDLNYFKYCFLKLTGVEFEEPRLEEEFVVLKDKLMNIYHEMPSERRAFLYRDFQSRNVMVRDGKPYYIDFQGGFIGPVYYDVASFLWQTRIAVPSEVRRNLLLEYHAAFREFYDISFAQFESNLRYFVFFRLLQVLGAYGFRGLHEKKTMFVSPIVQTLNELIGLDCSPYIGTLIESVAKLPQFQPQPENGPLVVRVTSFSYKKGIPEDYSGNGGGFVFDCRAPHNPGRYEEYKKLTGLDPAVIEFLEQQSSMPSFLEHVYGLVDPAVRTYLDRGFTSLAVNFGCTGGQHRSVYCAQHLAEHLASHFPEAQILLIHRELGKRQEFNVKY